MHKSNKASTAIALADKLCVFAPISNADNRITAITTPWNILLESIIL